MHCRHCNPGSLIGEGYEDYTRQQFSASSVVQQALAGKVALYPVCLHNLQREREACFGAQYIHGQDPFATSVGLGLLKGAHMIWLIRVHSVLFILIKWFYCTSCELSSVSLYL